MLDSCHALDCQCPPKFQVLALLGHGGNWEMGPVGHFCYWRCTLEGASGSPDLSSFSVSHCSHEENGVLLHTTTCCMCFLTTGPKSTGSSDHGQKLLKLWAHIEFSFLKITLSQVFEIMQRYPPSSTQIQSLSELYTRTLPHSRPTKHIWESLVCCKMTAQLVSNNCEKRTSHSYFLSYIPKAARRHTPLYECEVTTGSAGLAKWSQVPHAVYAEWIRLPTRRKWFWCLNVSLLLNFMEWWSNEIMKRIFGVWMKILQTRIEVPQFLYYLCEFNLIT